MATLRDLIMCAINIDDLAVLRLQELYFKVQDLKNYSPKNVKMIIEEMAVYRLLVDQMYAIRPAIFDNFYRIGLLELQDHLEVLACSNGLSSKRACFCDLQFYLQESILDARSVLIRQLSRPKKKMLKAFFEH